MMISCYLRKRYVEILLKLNFKKMFSYISAGLLAATALGCKGDFEYTSNGDDWHKIHNGKYSLCGTGQEQSPIDLSSRAAKSSVSLTHSNYFNIGVDAGFKKDDQGMKITFDDATRSKSNLSLTLPG